jgi:hypothetical protein
MAAPDIVNVTSILGKTAYDTDISNVSSAILTNATGSNKVLKVNTLIIANIDGANAADITVTLCAADANFQIEAGTDGGSSGNIVLDGTDGSSTDENSAILLQETVLSSLASTISVPNDSTLVVLSKDTSIYLEEDRAIFLSASAAGDLSGTISYEELDDA